MSGLDFLFNGQPPQSVTSSVSSVSGMPDWYQEYIRGIAGKATEAAGQGYTQYQDPRLAGFTPAQLQAFNLTQQNVGSWQPYAQGALQAAQQSLPTASAMLGAGAQYGSDAAGSASAAGQQAMNFAGMNGAPGAALGASDDAMAYARANAAPGAAFDASNAAMGYAGQNAAPGTALNAGQAALNIAGQNATQGIALGAGQAAMGAVGGQAPTWTNNYQQYMSPYTSGVVDEIARLGNRNLQEGALSSINDSFIGSGGFGSDRNADMIGRSIRDAQRDITGAQSAALQQGYATSANIFGQDAARLQAQQGLQASTALGAGQLGSNAANQYSQLGAGTALNAGQLGSTAQNQAAQLGANTALGAGQLNTGALNQYAQLGAGTAINAGQLSSGALGQYSQLGANTALGAGQLGANTALGAGQLSNAGAQIGAAAADQSAARLGALGQLQSQQGYQDAGALGAIGTTQQGLNQQGLDIGYQNFLEQRGWNWDTLNNLNSVTRGMQLPQSQTSVQNTPYGNVGTSPLQWANMLYGLGNANSTQQPRTNP